MTNRALPNPFPWAAEYQYSQSLLTDGELVFTAGQGGFGDDGAAARGARPPPAGASTSPIQPTARSLDPSPTPIATRSPRRSTPPRPPSRRGLRRPPSSGAASCGARPT